MARSSTNLTLDDDIKGRIEAQAEAEDREVRTLWERAATLYLAAFEGNPEPQLVTLSNELIGARLHPDADDEPEDTDAAG